MDIKRLQQLFQNIHELVVNARRMKSLGFVGHDNVKYVLKTRIPYLRQEIENLQSISMESSDYMDDLRSCEVRLQFLEDTYL